MKLSPINFQLSFNATVKSNTTRGRHTKIYNNGLSKREVAQHYDTQIALITKQKQKALELQDYMESREVKAILNQLPDEDVVEIDSLLKAKAFDGVDTIAPQKMRLYYDPNEYTDKYNLSDSKLRHITVQKDDRSIDKEKIKAWLNTICDYYKGKNN